jgi:NAD(P)-dependent dehydrogenase (short-subunit alcohol dehydrogenase family)
VRTVLSEFGHLDILINNAAVHGPEDKPHRRPTQGFRRAGKGC